MTTYTTIQGDTWDIIAKRVYGSESYTSLLMRSNIRLIDIMVFSQGTVIDIPDRPEHVETFQAWRD